MGAIKPLLPELPCRADKRGRPWRENRKAMNGILWILRSLDLTECFIDGTFIVAKKGAANW